MSALNPAPSLSSDGTKRPSDYDFGATSTTSMNQGAIPSPHTIALQHEWSSGLHFRPLLNDFGPSSLFSSPGYTNPANLTGLAPLNQLSSTVGEYQSDTLQFGVQLGGGG